jgi:IS30 family transposase
MQNGHAESFNGKLRDECLNATCFRNLADARKTIANWRDEYNGERPRSSLGYRTPNEFAELRLHFSRQATSPNETCVISSGISLPSSSIPSR